MKWFLVGFSPRKTDLSLYMGFNLDTMQPQLDALGKYKRGMGCLYLRSLADVDVKQMKAASAQ